jgi:hypothetical protein
VHKGGQQIFQSICRYIAPLNNIDINWRVIADIGIGPIVTSGEGLGDVPEPEQSQPDQRSSDELRQNTELEPEVTPMSVQVNVEANVNHHDVDKSISFEVRLIKLKLYMKSIYLSIKWIILVKKLI